jgi:hypothetical protein
MNKKLEIQYLQLSVTKHCIKHMKEIQISHIKTPVVFIIYNRPEKTQQSFASIQVYQPEILYIIADGPRNEEDELKVRKTREIVEQIDWNCEVIQIYSETNMSCGLRIYTGLNEVFESTEKAIIIEDDIVVSQDFFTFCSTMLNHYENDPRLMAVNGWNGWIEYNSNQQDAFLNKYNSVWGWATWKRAWEKYQFEPDHEIEMVSNSLKKYFNNHSREKLALHTYKQRLWQNYNTWDMQWNLAIFLNNGLIISSSRNLCSNIGFDLEGTHLTQEDFRKLYTPQIKSINTSKILIEEDYNTSLQKFDFGMELMSIVCTYDHVAKVMLLHKNPQIIPSNHNKIGWECQLEPFNHASLILEMLEVIEKKIEHPKLQKIKKVFQQLI